jgi:MFS family permease
VICRYVCDPRNCFDSAELQSRAVLALQATLHLQNIIEKRHSNTIRGEVLGWQTFATTVGSVLGPIALGHLSALSPTDGRLAFSTCGVVSLVAAVLYGVFVGRLLEQPQSSEVAHAL